MGTATSFQAGPAGPARSDVTYSCISPGETREEISQALRDLHDAGCDLITITQYLRPSARHHPVERWVEPDEFIEMQHEATEIGFAGVMSGPMVRSSYRAGSLYQQAIESGRGRA